MSMASLSSFRALAGGSAAAGMAGLQRKSSEQHLYLVPQYQTCKEDTIYYFPCIFFFTILAHSNVTMKFSNYWKMNVLWHGHWLCIHIAKSDSL